MSKKTAGRTIVAVDVGGTHARFALARISPDRRPRLDEPVTLKTRDHASLATAWEAFAAQLKGPLPKSASICVAAPLHADAIKLTNAHWVLRQSTLASDLGLDEVRLLNDFGAMAWAVAKLRPNELEPICGPDQPLPVEGVTTIVGPGTGLGVAILVRRQGRIEVVETEGGHIDFAPLDALESSIVERLRERLLRVSTERIVAGPGLANLYEALAALEGRATTPRGDAELWAAAVAGEDRLAASALERYCLALGAVTGDLALAHGANGVVLTGGISRRIADKLRGSGFELRFCAKGRYQAFMATLPVKLATHPQPGLLGAAAAFAHRA